MYSRTKTYDDFMNELNAILLPKFINATECNVFLETMLSAAGVETMPEECQITQDMQNDSALCFTLTDIAIDDAAKLNRLILHPDDYEYPLTLSETESLPDEDEVSRSYDRSDEEVIEDETLEERVKTTIQFSVPLKDAKKLLPIFANEVAYLNDADLEMYRRLSANNLHVLMYKLDHLFNEIMRLILELQSSAISDYMKGQLEVMIDELVLPTLELYHTNLKGHDCPPAMLLVEATKNNFKIYERKFATTEDLSSNPLASELKDDVTEYLASAEKIADIKSARKTASNLLNLLGMFGAQPESANVNRNIPGEDRINDLFAEDPELESIISNFRK